MAKTLIVASQPVIEGRVLASILRGGITTLDSVSFVTNSGKLPTGALPRDTYAVAFSLAEDAGAHEGQLLEELYRSLKHGATLTIIEKDHKDTSSLERHLVLAGFVGCRREVSPTGDAMKHETHAELYQCIGICIVKGAFIFVILLQLTLTRLVAQVEAQKPSWQASSTAPINLNRSKASSQGQRPSSSSQAPKFNLGNNEDDDLVDEDALLTEEDLQRPAPATDCGKKSTKKACKNCTCGRAEGQFEKVDLTPEMLENPQSGCGSCGLGDAFRCQTCPYRGLPAFEKGKRIELPQDFLTADA